MKDVTRLSTLVVREKKFHIVSFEQNGEKLYGAIDFDYVTDGKVNRELNGVQMHVSKDLNQCIEYARTSVEFDYWVSQGYDKAQAFEKVFHVELTDRAREIMLSN